MRHGTNEGMEIAIWEKDQPHEKVAISRAWKQV
jgi:hypothetical protein